MPEFYTTWQRKWFAVVFQAPTAFVAVLRVWLRSFYFGVSLIAGGKRGE
jgi:hypothetical protein